jgi:hypothetical protein
MRVQHQRRTQDTRCCRQVTSFALQHLRQWQMCPRSGPPQCLYPSTHVAPLVRCTSCRYRADRGIEELPELPRCPDCGELLRPDVVWFHEMLPEEVWREAARATAACECFLVVGGKSVKSRCMGRAHP